MHVYTVTVEDTWNFETNAQVVSVVASSLLDAVRKAEDYVGRTRYNVEAVSVLRGQKVDAE